MYRDVLGAPCVQGYETTEKSLWEAEFPDEGKQTQMTAVQRSEQAVWELSSSNNNHIGGENYTCDKVSGKVLECRLM